MNLLFTCDDKATLVAYLYDEIDAADRRRVDDHLRQCAACASEVAALAGVRTELTQWAPPHAELGFTVVAQATGKIVRSHATPPSTETPTATVLRPAQWWNTVPVWAQAVAAVLVLAISAAIANVQVRSGPDGLVVSTGWMTPAAATSVAPAGAAVAANAEAWRPALIALEQQLREEIRTTKETGTVRAASRSEVDNATVARVRALIEASETKQTRELAFRMTQLMGDINVQRRADLLRVEQAIGNTSVEMARQQQRLNYVIRASTAPQQ